MKVFQLLSLFFLFSMIVVGQNIPEELLAKGFSEKTLLNYEQDGDLEYYTFSDERTEEAGDIVTVVVENGKIQEWIESVTHKVFDDNG